MYSRTLSISVKKKMTFRSTNQMRIRANLLFCSPILRRKVATRLRAARIGYVHLRKLGGLRHARRDSQNMGWRNSSFRSFADYMQTLNSKQGYTIDEIGRAEAERDYVCGSSSLALPPFAHRRCAYCTRDSGRGYYEHETFPGSFAHFFCTRTGSSDHVPYPESRRRASLPSSFSRAFAEEPKNQGLRM